MRVTRLWTGKGDDGTTGLLFGGRAEKSSARIDAVGAVDEAQAVIGVARAETERGGELDVLLVAIERDLWVLMAELATAPEHRGKLVAEQSLVTPEMVQRIEAAIVDVGERFELPQEFVVDDQDGIGAPVGMTGARLEVNVHIVTGSVTSTQNLIACVNRAGVEVADTVIGQLAASEAVITPDEKELGVAMLDIGGGTADLAIFERGSLWHTAVIAVGGDHFTNDIAVGLRTPIPDAEKIKRRAGCALSAMVEEDETIEVASVGGRRPRVMARRILSEILQPRAEEIFHLVWDEISKAGYEKSLNSGLVLTGGGALLDGMSEIAEQIFDLPIRRGLPVGVGGMADHVSNPAYASAVGLVVYAHRNRGPEMVRGGSALTRMVGRLRTVFKEFF